MIVTTAIPLPEPLSRPVVPWPDVSGRKLVLDGQSGRLCLIEVDTNGGLEARQTCICPRELFSSRCREDPSERQWAGDRIVLRGGVPGPFARPSVIGDEEAYVCSLTTGDILLSIFQLNSGASVCLTPDGAVLMAWRSGAGLESFTSIYRIPVTPSGRAPRNFILGASNKPDDDFRTTILNRHRPFMLQGNREEWLESAYSAQAVPVPGESGLFHVVIGSDGYLADWLVSQGNSPQEMQIRGEPKLCGDFARDPVWVSKVAIYPYVFASTGGHPAAFHLETGSLTRCPVAMDRGYPFATMIPGQAGSLLVQTRSGWFRWTLDKGAEKICGSDLVLLGETQSGFWALHEDDPGRILHVARSGAGQ